MRVVITPYCVEWPAQFLALRTQLTAAFAPVLVAIEHIGSTSVPGLAAKPIIDILLGADSLARVEHAIPRLAELGYEYVPKYEVQLPMRRYFVRAASPSSLKVHLHCAVEDTDFWHEHIAFRDALRGNSVLLKQYQDLKVNLAASLDDFHAYTDAKAPFIEAALSSMRPKARREGKFLT